MTKKTPRFVRADGSFDKKAYNKWYYENHKDMYKQDHPRSRSNEYGPNPIEGYSKEQLAAQNLDNEKYYRDAMGKNKWTVSPREGTGYTDVGAYIDNAMDYARWNQDVNHKNKMRLAKESGASSTDIAKMDAQYKRAQAYADNERAKQLKSYQQIKSTYTNSNDVKLFKNKIEKEAKTFVRNYLDNYNAGMDTIMSQVRRGADWFNKASRFVSAILIGTAGGLVGATIATPMIVSRVAREVRNKRNSK